MRLIWFTSVCTVSLAEPLWMLIDTTGIGMLFCTYIYMVIWVWTGEVNAKRIRERYLKAVLRQDIAYFDNVGAGEVATRIQTDTRKFLSSPWRVSLLTQPS